MNYLAAVVALGLATLAPSTVQAQDYQSTRLIDNFTEQDLLAVLAERDASWQISKRSNGDPLYMITFESGLKAFAWFSACRDGQCFGLVLLAQFAGEDGNPDRTLEKRIRDFNDRYPAGKVFHDKNGNVFVQRYVMADYGITMRNLLTQIGVFEDIAQLYAKF